MRAVTFNQPFREAQALVETTITGSLFQIALAGRGYFLDTKDPDFKMESMEQMRPQQDDRELAGEGSLSNLDLWRRNARSWHLGAGQSRGDDAESSPYRFATSQGVDPWTQWKLSLLGETLLQSAGAASPATMVVAGGRAFHQVGPDIMVSDDGQNWSNLTTLTNAPTSRMVGVGDEMYVADSTAIRLVTTGGLESSAFTLGGANVIGFSKGRLWAGVGPALYWMIPLGTPTDANIDTWGGWEWTAIAEGPRCTYAAGYAGDKSLIYRIPLKDDGTGLDAGTVAMTLPDGEVCHALTSYLGFLIVGTSKGVRFAVTDDVGDLTPGSYIPTPEPVQCFEAQDRFVWFGWSDFSATHTGLGRLDLKSFTSTLTPAYASDLMYEGQGAVTGVVTFDDKRIFSVEGVGAAAEQDAPVAEGTLTTSDWTFDLDDDKIATLLGIKHEPLDGSVQAVIQVDGFGTAVVAESAVQGGVGPSRPYSLNPVRGHRFAVQLTLTAGVGDGPVLTGLKLMARPIPPQGLRIVLPIRLFEQLDTEGSYLPVNPFEEFLYLRSLWRAGAAVTLQIGSESFNVFPTNFVWKPYREMLDKTGWSGNCVMELREVTQ
jgi:hypothetical protein